jgi:hypothetical protein
MTIAKKEPAREWRIVNEIVVDAYDLCERAMAWYYHLEDFLGFPFVAKCASRRSISPLRVGDEVQVLGLPEVEECSREVFVTVRYNESQLAVPLSQLAVVKGDKATRQAVADWHYWVSRGYVY